MNREELKSEVEIVKSEKIEKDESTENAIEITDGNFHWKSDQVEFFSISSKILFCLNDHFYLISSQGYLFCSYFKSLCNPQKSIFV